MENQTDRKNNIIRQGSILAIASIVVRIIGLIYRIPMANIIGEEAMGIYSAAFEIYNIILILSSYSMPLAVSKLISERRIQKKYRNMYVCFLHSLISAIIIGSTASLFLYCNAKWIENNFLDKYTGVSISLKILAPTIFIVSIMGVFRGFFQGKNTMLPTAISQVIEQIINAIVSITAAGYLIKTHTLNHTAWGAAGGTLGTCIGALSGLLFLTFIFIIYFPSLQSQLRKYRFEKIDNTPLIYKSIYMTIIPIILSQTVYQINGVIDLTLFNNILGNQNVSEATISALQGNYSTLYKLLISVPIAVSSSFGGSIIPGIVSSYGNKQYSDTRNKVSQAILFNMNIAFPSTIGLMILGKPILALLFPNYNTELGGDLLFIGSVAIIFYAYSTITSSTLQGINRMKIPVINSSLALLFHIIIVYICLNNLNLGIYSLIIGNIIFPFTVSILNSTALKKNLHYHENKRKIILIPLLCSIIMGIICLSIYYMIFYMVKNNFLSVLLSITASFFSYFILILKLKGITGNELEEFPAGRTMFQLAKRLHLIT